jgi:hypothetical protein
MEALGMVYPQYWCVEDCKANYENHIQVIKAHYCQVKSTHQKITKSKRKGRKGDASTAVFEDGTNTNANGAAPLAIQVLPSTLQLNLTFACVYSMLMFLN